MIDESYIRTDPGELILDARYDDLFIDVYAYGEIWDWKSVRARYSRCPECFRYYRAMRWESTIPSFPHCVCPCGERFTLTMNRDREEPRL